MMLFILEKISALGGFSVDFSGNLERILRGYSDLLLIYQAIIWIYFSNSGYF